MSNKWEDEKWTKDHGPASQEPKKDDAPKYDDVQKELIKVATLLQKKGLKEKDAVVNRQRRVYFRSDHFHELVLEHSEEILKLWTTHNKLEKLDSVEDSKFLGDLFMNNGLMYAYDRIPDDVKKFKYPKKLMEVKKSMQEKGFYGFNIYKSQTKMAVLAIVLAIAVVAIILFPLWPYTVKLGIFNVLFYFSASIIGLAVVRLIVWIMLFPFGIDVWICPNMFDDDVGLVDSFLPLLLINRREDSWPIFAFRCLMVLAFALYWYHSAGFPLPVDEAVLTFNEIFEWGKDRMVGKHIF